MPRFSRTRLLTAISVLSATCLSAQSTATINGRIVDPSGATVGGATVEASNAATNFRRTTVTNTAGLYVLEALPVGEYSITARAPGFRTYTQTGITLQVNQRASIDVTLELGAVADQVQVEANVTQVDTVSGTLREVVDTQRIEALPLNGRNPLQLQALLPGVVSAGSVEHVGGLGGYAVNGGIAGSNNYYLDGGSFVDPYFNSPQYFPNPDALQEFTIQTNSSSAEYGRNRSAVIAAVTRSGTNNLHGSAFEFLRNTHLNARNFFAAQASPFPPESVWRSARRSHQAKQAVLLRLVRRISTERHSGSVHNHGAQRAGAAGKLQRALAADQRSADWTAVPC